MEIKGKKISIRDWKEKDFDSFRYWNKGKHLWMDFDGPYYPKMTDEEIENAVEKYTKLIIKKPLCSIRIRMVIADSETDKLLGTVVWYWQSKVSNWKSIGIIIYDSTYWTKGIGSEALKLWVNYLFEQDEKLTRLDLRTWSGNIRMIKLAQKIGFQEEACFRNARVVKGKTYDSIAMGILRKEWK